MSLRSTNPRADLQEKSPKALAGICILVVQNHMGRECGLPHCVWRESYYGLEDH